MGHETWVPATLARTHPGELGLREVREAAALTALQRPHVAQRGPIALAGVERWSAPPRRRTMRLSDY
jgi:hypothetical protein